MAIGATHQDFAIRLQSYIRAGIPNMTKVDRDLAIAVKGRIQAAIRLITSQDDVIIIKTAANPGNDDLALRQQRKRGGIVTNITEISGDPTVPIKGGVQAAISVVADQGNFKGGVSGH